MRMKKHNAGTTFADTLTDEQKSLLRSIREEAEHDPELAAIAKQYAKDTAAVDAEMRRAFETLKGLRLLKKVSLAELSQKSGISKSDLVALEKSPEPGVSLLVLSRYARALGKELRISLGDAAPTVSRRKAAASA